MEVSCCFIASFLVCFDSGSLIDVLFPTLACTHASDHPAPDTAAAATSAALTTADTVDQ